MILLAIVFYLKNLTKRILTMDKQTRYALIAEICERLVEEKQELEQAEAELNFNDEE